MKYLFYLFIISLSACNTNSPEEKTTALSKLVANLQDNPSICENTEALNIAPHTINQAALNNERCNWLSNYNLFSELSEIQVSENQVAVNGNGLLYQLNSALFTDFASKQRFIFIPPNQTAQYSDLDSFDFPIGTALVKIFSLKQASHQDIIEIRLLVKRENGWVFIPYIWLDEYQDAFLYRSGYTLATQVFNNERYLDVNYQIPSSGTCGECHQVKDESGNLNFLPIGPKARHLNKKITYQNNFINQLTLWQELGLLTGLPDSLSSIDTAPNWQDETANLQDRAKAYLDINCAHCHNEYGAAALSGLRLEYWRKSITHPHGVCNSSHGWRGGGFDIWPGVGEISSIPIRMRHTEPKDRMPPIGRSLVDEDAAALVSSWIDSLPYQSCAE